MGASVGVMLLVAVIAVPLAIVVLVYLLIPLGKGIVWFIKHVFRFVFSMIGDSLRVIGSLLTGLVLVPLTIVNVLIGRWSGAAHFGRAIQAEFKAIAACLYRLVIGHPARLFGLGAVTEGLERRIPQVVANAPGADTPSRRTGQFDGYKIVGSLPGGGSGGKLYVAEPSREKLAAFARSGQADVDKVVIKSFSMMDGSSLPQIVRENRALIAAKRLGLILDDELTADRFTYVMRYVPGEPLGVVAQRLHAVSGGIGLVGKQLSEAVEYGADLLRTLHHYHSGGLWHKDVKPDNIIVSDGQAHLVDFGLVTPLRSSMTLTTHGTEYFRDPEMVRMALRGVKVHEVDGAKFDIYAAGAVLYSMIENSFPAHGGLSQITKRCPEALRWIVRRAMTDYDKRYDSAATMLADVEAVLASADPNAFKPVDLPSVQAGQTPDMPEGQPMFAGGFRGSPRPSISDEVPVPRRVMAPAFAGAAAAAAMPMAGAVAPAEGMVFAAGLNGVKRPFMRVTNWWTGKYDSGAVGAAVAGAAAARGAGMSLNPTTPRVRPVGVTAAEQVARARTRAASARERAQARMSRYRGNYASGVNSGVVVACIVFFCLVGLGVTAFTMPRLLNKMWASAFGTSDDARDAIAQLENLPPIVIELGDGKRFELTPRIMEASGASRVEVKNGERHVIDDRRSSALPAFAPGTFGQVMVIRDQATYSADTTESVNRQIDALGRAGFALSGEQTAQPPTDDSVRQQQENALAELRSEVGVKPYASRDAGAAIRAWLERMPAYSMVVWFGRNDKDENETWLVARKGVQQDTVEHAAATLGDETTMTKAQEPPQPPDPATPHVPASHR